VTAFAGILFGYWLAWALYPAPAPPSTMRCGSACRLESSLHRFASHWNKNSNLGNAFDVWFLNLFPRQPFSVCRGGYQVLNFIPTLGTMLAGGVCGDGWLSVRPRRFRCASFWWRQAR